MDTNKWRPSQVGEAAMDAGDWRSQLQADSRQRIVNKIMDTLKRHLPFFGQDGLRELSKIVVRFEEKIYTAATSQSDYLRKISLRMLTMETKYQNSMGNPLQSNSAGKSNRPPDPGSFGMQPQVPNHGQSLSMPLPANQSQGRQPLLSQSIQNNIPPAGVQSSSDLSSALPPSSGLTQTPIPSIVGQNPNMQNMSGSSQNSLGNSMGQGVPSNVFANSQRQMPGRQQVAPQQQQPQQSQNSQNSQQYMYHQQMQHSLLKPKYQQGNMPQLVQQQQQQNLLQPTQLQSSQQSVMPTSSFMQLSVQSFLLSLQQNQQSAMQQSSQPMLQQHSQPVLRQQQQPQQVAVHQQQTPMAQQPILPQQQQQPLWRPSQVGEAAMDAGDWRSRLQADSRQRIVNKIMDTLKRHLPFSGQDGLQELSEIAVRLEEEIYTAATSQSDYLREISLKMLTMETKSQNSMGNPLQSNSAASLDSSAQTGYASGGDWQEEVYQKIKVMKEGYLPKLSEMYQVIATKVQKHDALPQQPKSEKLEKLKMFKSMLERLISVLQISKSSISPGLKDKLGLYEKQMVNFRNANRPRKQGRPLQQGQLPPPHMHSMQQPQSQIRQVQSHENQMNPQLQTMNLQGSVPTMQQNNMTSLEQNSMSSISGVSTAQQNMMNSLQLSTNLDSGQGNALNSLQQVPVGSIQQTPVSASHQANMNGLSSQSGVSMLQPNINSLQSNSGMLQHQQLKQQEQQMFQNQLKQQNQQQMQQQFIQKQQIPATATAATVAASKAAASSADGGEPTPNATAS